MQADQREEQADSCGDAELEIEWDGVDQPFAQRREGDQKEQEAGEKHDTERELPIAAELRHHGEGEIGVEPHAGRERDGVVGVEPHDGGRERGGKAGRDEHGAVVHAGLLQDRRVDEHDVGHGQEGGEAGAELGGHRGAGGGKAEIAVDGAQEVRSLRRTRPTVLCPFLGHRSPLCTRRRGSTGRSRIPWRS